MPPPLHDPIARELQELILSGQLAHDDQLPTEQQLADKHGVSRRTARDAYQQLQFANLARKHRGKGWLVIDPSGQHRYTREMGQPQALDARGDYTPTISPVHGAERQVPIGDVLIGSHPTPHDIAPYLGIPAGGDSLRRFRVMGYPRNPRRGRHQNELMALSISYIDLDLVKLAPRLAETDTGPGGMNARIADVVGPLADDEVLITAEYAGLDIAPHLKLIEGEVILRQRRILRAEKTGKTVAVLDQRMPGPKNQARIWVSRTPA